MKPMRKRSRPRKPTVKKIFHRFVILIALFIIFLSIGFLNYNKHTKTVRESFIIEHNIPTPIRSIRIPIILYHYVENVRDKKDTIRKSLSITPSIFRKQLETLKNAGYEFMTTAELSDVLDGRLKQPENPIIITFDDGYRDFYTDVFPVLNELKVKAVAYIVSDFIDKPNFMYQSQIREIAKSGLVEIGAHTVHHKLLKGLPRQLAFFEINKSKERLSQILGIPIVSFAYPYGAFDDQTVEIVKEVGFKTAVRTTPGIEASQNNRYKLYRIRAGQRIGNELLGFLKQSVFIDY